jgi:hypothetical protein
LSFLYRFIIVRLTGHHQSPHRTLPATPESGVPEYDSTSRPTCSRRWLDTTSDPIICAKSRLRITANELSQRTTIRVFVVRNDDMTVLYNAARMERAVFGVSHVVAHVTIMVLLPLAIAGPSLLLMILPRPFDQVAGLALGASTICYSLMFCPVDRYKEIATYLAENLPRNGVVAYSGFRDANLVVDLAAIPGRTDSRCRDRKAAVFRSGRGTPAGSQTVRSQRGGNSRAIARPGSTFLRN